MTIYQELATDADSMLAQYGYPVGLTRLLVSGDPWDSAPTEQNSTITGVIIPIESIEDSFRLDASSVLYTRTEVFNGDKFEYDGRSYVAGSVKKYGGAGVSLLYEAYLK